MSPTIGITSGDPAGIGLEVCLKALPAVLKEARWILYTNRGLFDRHRERFGRDLQYRWISRPDDARADGTLCLIDLEESALAFLRAGADDALAGRLSGIVTAPVRKSEMGPGFRGQTDYLAERSQVDDYAMAFFAPTFKVVLVTVHMSLRNALDTLSTELYVRRLRLIDREWKRLNLPQPRIAIAAVNPHAGEGGMFGSEDDAILRPAVNAVRNEGILAFGPLSADSLYYRAHTGEFDVILAPYHDQALGPVKLIAHGDSVNVTLGLPFFRTSPDHGTALDIAGKGIADPGGMASALRCALDLASARSGQ